jgi:hypothetical protein
MLLDSGGLLSVGASVCAKPCSGNDELVFHSGTRKPAVKGLRALSVRTAILKCLALSPPRYRIVLR